MDDVLRLLPEPDEDGTFRWEDGATIRQAANSTAWEVKCRGFQAAYFSTPEKAAVQAAAAGHGPTLLAAAHHRHPPRDEGERLAWAVLAGDDVEAAYLADLVLIERVRPVGAKTVREQQASLLEKVGHAKAREAALRGWLAGLRSGASHLLISVIDEFIRSLDHVMEALSE